MALSDDRDGTPDERDHSEPRQPRPRVDPQGPEDPALHRTASQTEDDVPLQPVAASFHDEPGQPACQHSSENHDWNMTTRPPSPPYRAWFESRPDTFVDLLLNLVYIIV